MILPGKHSDSDRSLIVLGGRILALLEEPNELGSLWDQVRERGFVSSFERFYSAILFLFVLGAVDLTDGRIALRDVE